ncbi:hypothetical protein N9Z41_01005 [bacterium]|nr:hypothetical protein [bacterium]
MDTTELIKNSLDWADKRLSLKGEKLTEEQRNYITFALRQNLVKNMAVTHCCKSDSELLPYKDEKLIGNMCLSFRHDFGLLPKLIQDDLKRDCKNWLIAYENNRK